MKNKYTAIVAVIIGCGGMHGAAQAQWAPDFKFSGFGTVGAVRTNTDEAKYGRDRQYLGADTNASFDVDSNLGLQATATVNSWLSGTVQVLSVKRQTENHLTTQAEWGFVKVKPLDGLTLRAGRMAVPVFMISDSLNVGYSNNWLRAPNEVYGLVSFRRLQGFDVTYQMPIASTTLTVSALAGTSRTEFYFNPTTVLRFKMKDVRGLNAQLETEWGTFRVGKITAKYDTAAAPEYSFTGFGYALDHNNVIVQAEKVMRRSPTVPGGEQDGQYVMLGYRLGSVLPYTMVSSTKFKRQTASNTTGKQSTTALGLRWDAMKATSVKFQLDRVDTKGTKGASFLTPVSKPVTVVSAAVDFVF